MKFNGTEVYAAMGDQKRFPVPVLKVGQKIRLLHDDETMPLPGSRAMKKGVYVVINVGPSVGSGFAYRLVKDTKNSRYDHRYNTIAIDKAILQGFIEVVE